MQESKNSITFIHILRGLAALLVMASHWMCNFYCNHDSCAASGMFTPLQIEHYPFWTPFFMRFNKINLGMIGVCLFFLITGYLISYSAKKGPGNFIIGRLLRIYPLYWVGLLIDYCILFFCSRINDMEYHHSIPTLLKNATLFRPLFGAPTVDGVSWTLECQIFFYALVAVMCLLLKDKWNTDKSVLIVSAIGTVLIFVLGMADGVVNPDYTTLKMLIYLIRRNLDTADIMLIGVSLFKYRNKEWDRATFLRTFFIQLILVAINIGMFFPEDRGENWGNYGFALFVFIIFWLLENKVQFQNAVFTPVKKFADISFPFYVLHGAAGYGVMGILYRFTTNPYIVLLITFAIFVLLSFGVHKLAEEPMGRLIKKIKH